MDRTGQILANRGCLNDWYAIVRAIHRHGRVAQVAIEACTGAAWPHISKVVNNLRLRG